MGHGRDCAGALRAGGSMDARTPNSTYQAGDQVWSIDVRSGIYAALREFEMWGSLFNVDVVPSAKRRQSRRHTSRPVLAFIALPAIRQSRDFSGLVSYGENFVEPPLKLASMPNVWNNVISLAACKRLWHR
jgi:hypothetical protein